MTEAAITSGGVDTPAEPVGAPIEAPVDTPQALGSQTPVAEKPPEPKAEEVPKTAGDAVRKAMDKVKADQAAKDAEKAEAAKAEPVKDEPVKADAKPEVAKPETEQKAAERGPDGKFVAKASDATAEGAEGQQQPTEGQEQAKPGIHEAPARFDAAAKAEWANAPESVKGAVHRTIRELETGIEEHRARWEPIKQYDEMARQYETDLPSALERYVSMDKLLSQDLAQGLETIVRDKTGGQLGLRDVIAHITGQKPDETQSQHDATAHQMRQELSGLKQQLGSVTQVIQRQAVTQTQEQVTAFAADKPDFDALSGKIAEHIRNGQDLAAAYQSARHEAEEMARTLGFVPASTQTPSQPLSPASQPAPLKPAGQKSVSGAPATGSDPASTTRKAPATSIREALERAKARVA